MNIKSKKKELRRLIAERRTSADPALLAEESARLVQEIEESDFFMSAGCVMAYWPMKGEMDLRALIIKHHPAKRFCCPLLQVMCWNCVCLKGKRVWLRAVAMGFWSQMVRRSGITQRLIWYWCREWLLTGRAIAWGMGWRITTVCCRDSPEPIR